jgi:hypothetical protein
VSALAVADLRDMDPEGLQPLAEDKGETLGEVATDFMRGEMAKVLALGKARATAGEDAVSVKEAS